MLLYASDNIVIDDGSSVFVVASEWIRFPCTNNVYAENNTNYTSVLVQYWIIILKSPAMYTNIGFVYLVARLLLPNVKNCVTKV